MLLKLEQFICDTCGHIINNPSEGFVEWKSENKIFKGFKIIHGRHYSPLIRGCHQHNQCSLPLTDFLGVDGLNTHLRLMSGHGATACDTKDIIELMRRTHIPYYEEGRQYLEYLIHDYRLQGLNDSTIYGEENLKKIIQNQDCDPYTSF